jgi:hypothetical protein
MSDLKRQPEFEHAPGREQLSSVPALSQIASPFAAARNDAGALRVRRRSRATRLDMSRDDGFHLFRVY